MNLKNSEFCQCDFPNYRKEKIRHRQLICTTCNKPIECEFSILDLEKSHAATLVHVDYCCCKKHEDAAIDNVYLRDQSG